MKIDFYNETAESLEKKRKDLPARQFNQSVEVVITGAELKNPTVSGGVAMPAPDSYTLLSNLERPVDVYTDECQAAIKAFFEKNAKFDDVLAALVQPKEEPKEGNDN